MNSIFSVASRRVVVPAAVMVSTFLLTSITSTRADEGGGESKTRVEEKVDESDSYENLPEEDERTYCSMCLLNRQGPCRDPWRKFERCLKDNPVTNNDKEDGASEEAVDTENRSANCDPYMMSWLTCIQSYPNMYALYHNYMSQLEYIEPLEKEIRENEVFELKDVDVDWTPYVEWVKSEGLTLWELYSDLQLFAPSVTPRPKFHEKDPEMVELEVNIKAEDNGLPLQIVYAKDQGGLVLGMKQFSSQEEQATVEGTAALKFSFRPGMTSHVQFFALYNKDDDEECRFLCSAPQNLVKVASEAGKIPEGSWRS